MLTQKITSETGIISVSIQDKSINTLLDKEWLLTNSRGGFTSSSIIGCNTRRYHSLLTGSHTPPANRIAALSNCLETITAKDHAFSLSNFEFDNAMHPNGYSHLLEFRKDIGVHFEYETVTSNLKKSIYLLPDSDTVSIVYEFSNVRQPFEFSIRPFAAMRDFHSLGHSGRNLSSVWNENNVSIRNESPEMGQLTMYSDSMRFDQDPQWWHRFFYRKERQRGQDCLEDLWSPGQYKQHIEGPQRIILWASLFDNDEPQDTLESMELEAVIDAVRLKQKELLRKNPPQDAIDHVLTLAADQFIIERSIDNEQTPTILAGFPWFLDWGRDTFISLEGLCLATGRFDVAWGVLKTFAKAVSEGMIPNRFDDYGNQPHYNSIDASLWFVHAAFRYLRTTGDQPNFAAKLLPAVKWIMDSYRKGTRFGIHADKDKLITGGDVNTQLSWMDAKFDGISFTPRYGKAVEINALWYSNLCELTEYYRNKNEDSFRFYALLSEQVRCSFRQQFWDEHLGYLNDCVLASNKADNSIRPNQIFAVSLPYSPLSGDQQRKVVDVVEKELLTPYGLRSLSPSDPRYKGRCTGPQSQRDAAYHQGTVWGFLIGPFVEAYLKVHGFDPTAKRRCRTFLSKLIEHLNNDGCLGSISEIFDGDAPHEPRGAFAQAWSVAEVLRTWQMCRKG
ncbi:MAG: amylo-alpha-1,6-glucosidase [Planctomycetota bacterium]|jgi:predicted glycogen debranching enzyme